jgi:predicted small integral membrane protein
MEPGLKDILLMRINIWPMGHTSLLLGLAIWMSIVVINNITDSGTNQYLIGQMLSMVLIKDDPIMGNGLEWRAWNPSVATVVLNVVVVIQIGIAALLWRASTCYLGLLNNDTEINRQRAQNSAVVALVAFCELWIVFLCGGLWFGYWMKQGTIQQVHFTLFLVGIGGLILINVPMPSSYGTADKTKP